MHKKEHHFSENGKYSPFEEKTTKNENIELSETLEEAKKRNETAESRVIGMAIETRPDWITIEEIKRLRRYGITRVGDWLSDDRMMISMNKIYAVMGTLSQFLQPNCSRMLDLRWWHI